LDFLLFYDKLGGAKFGLHAKMNLKIWLNPLEVNVLDSGDADAENLALSGRPDLVVTFTKLHCWRLTQYSKCVFLDADRFVIKFQIFNHIFQFKRLSEIAMNCSIDPDFQPFPTLDGPIASIQVILP
jgi:hypothetical protein